MKKLIIFMLFVVLTGSVFYAQYNEYDRNNYDDYRNDRSYYDDQDYDDNFMDYNYGYESARPYLSGYRGPLYYWVHPYEDLYFVAVGSRVFLIPSFEIRRIWSYYRWNLVTRSSFISMTCFGMPYYDNYMRFNHYCDYFHRHRYSRFNNIFIRSSFRKHYRGRRHSRSYYKNYKTVVRSKNYRRGADRRQGSYNSYSKKRTLSSKRRSSSPSRYKSSRTVVKPKVTKRYSSSSTRYKRPSGSYSGKGYAKKSKSYNYRTPSKSKYRSSSSPKRYSSSSKSYKKSKRSNYRVPSKSKYRSSSSSKRSARSSKSYKKSSSGKSRSKSSKRSTRSKVKRKK